MRRRGVIAAGGLLVLAAGAGSARVAGRPARIAWPASLPITQWPPYAEFVMAMRERGWIEGTHYVVDAVSYDGNPQRIPAVVAELMARKPDLIIGGGTAAMRPLMQATKTIPIVMFSVGDPQGQGFVASLARPEGNVTGLSTADHGLVGKQFDLLLQALPQVRRVGAVYTPDIPPHALALRDVEALAQRRGVQLSAVPMRTRDDIDAAFDALQRERVEAVHFFPQTILNTGDSTARIAALALQRRWPTAMADLPHVRAGILLAYGWKNEDQLRRLPHYVIRILEGTPPGELPVEQPTRFYLWVNQKTAKGLGLTLPQSLLLQADEVVE
jgi:putative ABC transport system substrate-binding protein